MSDDAEKVYDGKALLRAILPISKTGSIELPGFPLFSPLSSENRKETEAMRKAIEAELKDQGLTPDTDYDWSYFQRGDKAVLNLTNPAHEKLKKNINQEMSR